MFLDFRFRRQAIASALGAACLLAQANLSFAVMTHQYTFNDGTANDAVAFVAGDGITTFDIGGANGTIVDNTNIRTFVGGALDLTANNGAGSAQDFTNPATVGAFVNLPNGIIKNAFNGGSFGAATIETWATVQENRDWSRLWDFGNSGPGEDLSGGSGGAQYIFFAPRIGGNGSGSQFVAAASSHNADPVGDVFVPDTAPLTLNVKHHITVTYDQTDLTGSANGTAKLYIDNQPVIVRGIAGGLDLTVLNDFNNFIGRAQWGDPLFDGSIDELRIYDTALTQGQIAANTPVPVPLPVLQVDRATGMVSIRNPAGTPLSLLGYSISSANGELNPTGFQPINTGGTFDPNGTWTGPAASNASIAESMTSGNADGGSLAGGASRSLGTAWLRTPLTPDLQFNYTLVGGASGLGTVEYLNSTAARSDLDGNGLINAADWAVFVANHNTSLTALLPAIAYTKGDLDGNKTNDYSDFVLFKADYIAANGGAAFAALTGVPEPTSVALALISVGVVAVRARKVASLK